VYPGFCSCDNVGTNHPVKGVAQASAVKTASSLQDQVLETSLHLGATIHAVPDALQITCPPLDQEPKSLARLCKLKLSVTISRLNAPETEPPKN
jgi:hypothetical protein